MRILLLVLLLLHAAGQIAAAQSPPTLLDPTALEPKVDTLVRQYQDLDIFSGVVLIAERGEPVYHKAFGLADRDKNTPNTLDTRFDIGSMNKSFTKLVALQLVNEGVLNLDDHLGDYLDDFPAEAAEHITVQHLLEHQSGYGGYHDETYWNSPPEKRDLAFAVDLIRRRPLEFAPGTDRSYSNAGYVLLGAIIEKATGKSYFDVVEARILQPLGMQNTYLRDKYATPKRAIGYYKNMKGELENNEWLQEPPTPAGGFYSTTSDMLKFYRAFHYGDELWDEATRSLDGRHRFYQEHQNSGGAMTHAGGFEGANTVHFEILRDQISVVVFANMDEVVAEDLGAGILAIIRGQEPQKPALPAIQSVYQAWQEHGIDYVREHFANLTTNFHPDDPKDLILNNVGYNLLFSEETEAAVEFFRLNTELFPGVANVWDSYGEGLRKQGKKAEALAAYRQALAIRPDLESARAAVAELTRKE